MLNVTPSCITEEGAAFTYNRTSETMELTSNKVSRSKLRNSLPPLTNRHVELSEL